MSDQETKDRESKVKKLAEQIAGTVDFKEYKAKLDDLDFVYGSMLALVAVLERKGLITHDEISDEFDAEVQNRITKRCRAVAEAYIMKGKTFNDYLRQTAQIEQQQAAMRDVLGSLIGGQPCQCENCRNERGEDSDAEEENP